MQQHFEAVKGKNPEEVQRVRDSIIKYNKELPDWGKGKVITGDALLQSAQARERDRLAKEIGVPTQRGNVPIARHIQSLYPEERTVDVRRVR
jgi:hypothetical protein